MFLLYGNWNSFYS